MQEAPARQRGEIAKQHAVVGIPDADGVDGDAVAARLQFAVGDAVKTRAARFVEESGVALVVPDETRASLYPLMTGTDPPAQFRASIQLPVLPPQAATGSTIASRTPLPLVQ